MINCESTANKECQGWQSQSSWSVAGPLFTQYLPIPDSWKLLNTNLCNIRQQLYILVERFFFTLELHAWPVASKSVVVRSGSRCGVYMGVSGNEKCWVPQGHWHEMSGNFKGSKVVIVFLIFSFYASCPSLKNNPNYGKKSFYKNSFHLGMDLYICMETKQGWNTGRLHYYRKMFK